jgi:dolichol-phosphate mannosyltransferase
MVSVILPTRNERGNIVPLILAIREQLAAVDHEILVVDDNSSDGTLEAVDELKDPKVKSILRTTDLGLANSIRCGIDNAAGDVLVIMDSDFNHPPEYLPFMIDALEYYDCVSGSRFLYGGRMNIPSRHYASWVFNIFTRIMTGGQITDSLAGFLAIRRETIARCNFEDIFWGYGDYCIRLMYYLQQSGAKILQIPIVHGERLAGDGNSRLVRVFWQYLREVLALARKKGRISMAGSAAGETNDPWKRDPKTAAPSKRTNETPPNGQPASGKPRSGAGHAA